MENLRQRGRRRYPPSHIDLTAFEFEQVQQLTQAGSTHPNPDQHLFDPQLSDKQSVQDIIKHVDGWDNRAFGQRTIETALDDTMPFNPGGETEQLAPSINSQVDQYNTMLERLLSLGELADKMNTLINQMTVLINFMYRQRIVEDTNTMISATQEYEVNYHDRQFLFLYSPVALTLVLNGGGTKAVVANAWTGINFSKGMKLTAQGILAPGIMVTIRACDTLLALN